MSNSIKLFIILAFFITFLCILLYEIYKILALE